MRTIDNLTTQEDTRVVNVQPLFWGSIDASGRHVSDCSAVYDHRSLRWRRRPGAIVVAPAGGKSQHAVVLDRLLGATLSRHMASASKVSATRSPVGVPANGATTNSSGGGVGPSLPSGAATITPSASDPQGDSVAVSGLVASIGTPNPNSPGNYLIQCSHNDSAYAGNALGFCALVVVHDSLTGNQTAVNNSASVVIFDACGTHAGLGIFGQSSGCVALVGGRPTIIGTLGGGGSSGAASLTGGVLFSNAHSPRELRRWFGFVGASGDFGLSVGDQFAAGSGDCGRSIWENESSVGVGLDLPVPFETHGGVSYTWAWSP
jgi:hypothetical protein